VETEVVRKARLAEVSAVVLGAGVGTRVLETRGARVADPAAVERVLRALRTTVTSAGEGLIYSSGYQRVLSNGIPRVLTIMANGPELRAITGYVSPISPTGFETVRPGPTPLLARLEVIPVENSIAPWFKETGTASEAAGTAWGTALPAAAEVFARDDKTLKRFGIWSGAVDAKILEDSRVAQRFVDAVLIRAFRLGLEKAVLTGDGVGENLTGITVLAGVASIARGATNHVDVVVDARRALEADGFYDGHILIAHPTDLKTFRIATADKAGGAGKALDGLDILPSRGLTAGTVVVWAPAEGAALLTKGTTSIVISSEHSDLWLKAQVAARIQVELELPIDPKSAQKITGF
jgi:hypothetical protein